MYLTLTKLELTTFSVLSAPPWPFTIVLQTVPILVRSKPHIYTHAINRSEAKTFTLLCYGQSETRLFFDPDSGLGEFDSLGGQNVSLQISVLRFVVILWVLISLETSVGIGNASFSGYCYAAASELTFGRLSPGVHEDWMNENDGLSNGIHWTWRPLDVRLIHSMHGCDIVYFTYCWHSYGLDHHLLIYVGDVLWTFPAPGCSQLICLIPLLNCCHLEPLLRCQLEQRWKASSLETNGVAYRSACRVSNNLINQSIWSINQDHYIEKLDGSEVFSGSVGWCSERGRPSDPAVTAYWPHHGRNAQASTTSFRAVQWQ